MMPKTRLDKLVQLREREEEDAAVDLARAQQTLRAARERLEQAVEASRADARAPGNAALWELEENAHRRALQLVRKAEGEVSTASVKREGASLCYREARQDAETVRRVADRKRAELRLELTRRERRVLDEVATLRFNQR